MCAKKLEQIVEQLPNFYNFVKFCSNEGTPQNPTKAFSAAQKQF